MIPTPIGPGIPMPIPAPQPGGRAPSPMVLAYKVLEDLEELKKQVAALVSRFEALERRVAAIESAKTA